MGVNALNEMSDKRKRSGNFNKSEIKILVDIIFKYKHIIGNKVTNGAAWAEKKKAWEDIAQEFNSLSGNFPRTPYTLKLKYNAIKKDIRKSILVKENANRTGGSLSEVDYLSGRKEKILSMTTLSMAGLQSVCDETNQQPLISGDCTDASMNSMTFKIESLDDEEIGDNQPLTSEDCADTSMNSMPYKIEILDDEENEVQNEILNNKSHVSNTTVSSTNLPETETTSTSKKRSALTSENVETVVSLKKKLLQLQATLLEEEIESKRQSRKIENEILRTNLESAKIELEIKKKKLEEMEE